MARRPFSESEIELLKSTPYVKSQPLSKFEIFFLILFWPAGLYYLISKNTPEYMLSKCQTDEAREALFAYLRSTPDVDTSNKKADILRKHALSRTFGVPFLGIPSYFYMRVNRH